MAEGDGTRVVRAGLPARAQGEPLLPGPTFAAPYHLVGHRSHSYVRSDDGVKEQRFDFDSGITVSNGGLNAPPGDMATTSIAMPSCDAIG